MESPAQLKQGFYISLPLTVRTESHRPTVINSIVLVGAGVLTLLSVIWARIGAPDHQGYWVLAVLFFIIACYAAMGVIGHNRSNIHDTTHVIDRHVVRTTVLPVKTVLQFGNSQGSHWEEPLEYYRGIVIEDSISVDSVDFYYVWLDHPDEKKTIRFDAYTAREPRDRFAWELSRKLNLPVSMA